VNDFYGVYDQLQQVGDQARRHRARERGGAPWVKYIHGDYGKGTWTYYGGHDPRIRSTRSATRRRPLVVQEFSRYRLILNNVCSPPAKKKPVKT
jgi:hypothetical protein